MPDRIRFHLDENMDAAIAEELIRRGIDVTTSRSAELISATDEEQLAFAAEEGRVLVTHDDDFLGLHARGWEHAGIAFCHAQARSIGELIRGLELIWDVLEAEEMQNHVEFL